MLDGDVSGGSGGNVGVESQFALCGEGRGRDGVMENIGIARGGYSKLKGGIGQKGVSSWWMRWWMEAVGRGGARRGLHDQGEYFISVPDSESAMYDEKGRRSIEARIERLDDSNHSKAMGAPAKEEGTK